MDSIFINSLLNDLNKSALYYCNNNTIAPDRVNACSRLEDTKKGLDSGYDDGCNACSRSDNTKKGPWI